MILATRPQDLERLIAVAAQGNRFEMDLVETIVALTTMYRNSFETISAAAEIIRDTAERSGHYGHDYDVFPGTNK